MRIKDYFSKTFETCDNHEIPSLRTHYYRERKENVIEACKQTILEMKGCVKSVDEERGEMMIDSMNFSGTLTVTATSITEIAVDFQILTYNLFPTAPGIKYINKFYSILDKKVPLKGIGLHAR